MTAINLKELMKSHVKKIAAKSSVASTTMSERDTLLYWGTHADTDYLPQLKACTGSATVFLRSEKVATLTQFLLYCDRTGIDKVVTSSVSLLSLLLVWDKRKAPALKSYMGSHFRVPAWKSEDKRQAGLSHDIEIVIIPPIKQLVTVPYAKFLTTRYISKLLTPDTWHIPTKFSWDILDAANEEAFHKLFLSADLICIDIETLRENAVIRCLSYTAFFLDGDSPDGWTSESLVLPMNSEYNLAIMRKWNWNLKAPKIFQNGKYDIAYLARYNAPIYNYLYDTANMFHCIFSEMPKDLGFLNAFYIREATYWKDLAHTNDLHEYYRYNALDTWGTGNAFLAMMKEAPEYALTNYKLEFPLVFPCHLAEMTGIKRDMTELVTARAEQDKIIETKSASLNKILGVAKGETFNVKSPIQMKALLKTLGCQDLPTAGEADLIKARFRHPFNARIINLVLDIRSARTLKEKYLQIGSAAKEFPRAGEIGSDRHEGRVLYSLNPHATDSSRLASREHHFWCGLQIQNITRGRSVKRTLCADDGFMLCEVDLAQAESRDTAYISGDKSLIESVEHSPDFHSSNASKFFGVPFEEIFDEAIGKVINKPLRQLAKPVNHGANYNMGEFMLVQQMGEEMILKAKHLLKLPAPWSYKEVARHLLAQFHSTYPDIKGVFYRGVVQEILTTGFLVHHLPDGEPAWTRRCFGDPTKSKSALNSYIAHPPQSLNAQTLNKAWLDVFHNIAMHTKYNPHFKLLAQIHDSILFQHRVGHEYLKEKVIDAMEIPVTIRSYKEGSVYKTFTVPADASSSATHWSDLKD